MEMVEYLFAGFIMIAILMGSTTMMMMSEPHMGISGKEQLKVAAQKIMNQLILDPGTPPDWGSNLTLQVSELGLAKYGETTRDAYVLDPDKVQRLMSIPANQAAKLLNLEKEYGFRLELKPALNVSVSNKTQGNILNVNINVTSEGYIPIVGAIVMARIYYYDDSGFNFINGSTVTGVDGTCTLSFNMKGGLQNEPKVLFLVVDYNGIRVVKVDKIVQDPNKSDVVRVQLFGNRLINLPSGLKDEVLEIISVKGDKGLDIINVSHKLNQTTGELSYLEPSIEAVLAVYSSQKGQVKKVLYYASRDVTLSSYSTISGVGIENLTPFSYSLERSVVIGGSIYILRLYIWRMSW